MGWDAVAALALIVVLVSIAVAMVRGYAKGKAATERVEALEDDEKAERKYEENRRTVRAGLRDLTKRWLSDLAKSKRP